MSVGISPGANGPKPWALKSNQADAPYYEQWLAALEKIVEAKGLMSQVERLNRVDAWDRAAHATPHGQPIELSRS